MTRGSARSTDLVSSARPEGAAAPRRAAGGQQQLPGVAADADRAQSIVDSLERPHWFSRDLTLAIRHVCREAGLSRGDQLQMVDEMLEMGPTGRRRPRDAYHDRTAAYFGRREGVTAQAVHQRRNRLVAALLIEVSERRPGRALRVALGPWAIDVIDRVRGVQAELGGVQAELGGVQAELGGVQAELGPVPPQMVVDGPDDGDGPPAPAAHERPRWESTTICQCGRAPLCWSPEQMQRAERVRELDGVCKLCRAEAGTIPPDPPDRPRPGTRGDSDSDPRSPDPLAMIRAVKASLRSPRSER